MKKMIFGAALLALSAMPLVAQTLMINEFMADNDNIIQDDAGDFDDWVELYNYGDEAVDIAGLWFTDGEEDPWQIPSGSPEVTTVQPLGFILVWFDKDTEQGPLHVDAKLAREGESIVIYQEDGTTILTDYDFEEQETDVSEGRETDGGEDWVRFAEPTPGASNDGNAVSHQLQPVTHSLLALYPNPCNPSATIELNLTEAGLATIRVYDLGGRLRQRKDLGYLGVGVYHTQLHLGDALPSGNYLVDVAIGAYHLNSRLVLLR